MKKKTVWLEVTIDLECDDGIDDEALMDFANDAAVEAGFIVDDMGIYKGEWEVNEENK